MKVLVLHHHGNEITEFIAPIDIMKRAGIEVHVVHQTCLDEPLENEGLSGNRRSQRRRGRGD